MMGKESVLSSINTKEYEMASVLSSLKVINAVKQIANDSTQFRREKLCKKLDEQISLAKAVKDGNTFTVKRQRNIKDKESGLSTTVEVNKKVRQWWFVNRDTNKVALQLRYGTKVIEFAKGKNAIEVNSGEELITTLQKLRTATMSGELDEIITTTSLLVKARFKK
jgi:hypothetical protein